MYKIGNLTTDNIQAVFNYMSRNGYTKLSDFIASQEEEIIEAPIVDEIETELED